VAAAEVCRLRIFSSGQRPAPSECAEDGRISTPDHGANPWPEDVRSCGAELGRPGHRGAVRNDPAVDHVDDAVGSGRHGLVVSDEHDRRGAVPAQPLEESKDHVDRCAVEAPGGFVGQQHCRVVGQCTGDRDPLALAPES